MNYIGEHLLPGQLGHFFAILSLVASLIATIAFFIAARSKKEIESKSWLRLSRIVFLVETVAVIGIFICLYYIVSNHYNEYYFAWNHSSRSLQPEYLLSCIWEDQSGSFLLWNIWHCVLGWIFIWRNKQWEAPVLTVLNLVQFCIATMLIGIYVFNLRIGNNPFILFREHMPDMPVFSNPDYLSLPRIYEGNDLNTLLQNYWMVIHPPVLFLGFASTVIPFGFACAGLMKNDHTWTKSALPWVSFSAAILGLGIMMGAAWAYESLTFGGYWAWDPVENASLVPWLTLIAGLHTNLIYKHSGYSLKTTYVFYLISFMLILYSTFLTRSGVLGDSSVHAFAESDMNSQLYLFLNIFIWLPVFIAMNTQKGKIFAVAAFVILCILSCYLPFVTLVSVLAAFILLFYALRHLPVMQREESTYSREFWMFIGALVLFLSALVIIVKTSLPVYNKIFHTDIAQPEDSEFSYNQIQIFIAIIIGILTAVTQYLKYKDTPKAFFGKRIVWPTLAALVVSLAITLLGGVNYDKKGIGFLIAIHLAIFAATYAIIANAAYIWVGLKGKMKSAGASIAHVGFGILLLGILISSSKKTILSWNTTGISTLKSDSNEKPAENITLFKGIRTDMGKYHVTYQSDSINPYDRKKYFTLKFENKETGEQFFIYPDVLKNNKGMEGYTANPAAKHYWNKDIFVYITSWYEGKKEDTTGFKNSIIKTGDTLFYSKGQIILNKIEVDTGQIKYKLQPGELGMIMDISVVASDSSRFSAKPGIIANISTNDIRNIPDTVVSQNLILKFNRLIDGDHHRFEIGIKENKTSDDLLTLKVYEFPFITLVWLGVIVTMIGFFVSIVYRIRK